MSSATIRISKTSRETLKQLAIQQGKTMQAVLERSIELYRRHRLLEETNQAYAALRQDRKRWDALEAERKQWDTTLQDGLDTKKAPVKRRKKGV
ncbi:MAG TPA: toxin-antitoxin system protein [Candidatus Bipolaricaulota bacterium]